MLLRAATLNTKAVISAAGIRPFRNRISQSGQRLLNTLTRVLDRQAPCAKKHEQQKSQIPQTLNRRPISTKSALFAQDTPLTSSSTVSAKSESGYETRELNDGYTKITTFPNGLRVTTEDSANPGHFSAIGVYVDAGSRYETEETSGYAHIMDRMSFNTSQKYNSEEMLSRIEALGGSIMCSSSRECIMYQAAVFPTDVPKALELLSETVLRPKFLESELDSIRQTIPWELHDLEEKPEMWLPEVTHTVAYGGQVLGKPLLCPPKQLDIISSDRLTQYWRDWYRPDRMVVAGVGVDHEQLVQLCKDFGFADQQSGSSSSPSIADSSILSGGSGSLNGVMKNMLRSRIYRSYNAPKSPAELAAMKSVYTGGISLEPKEGQEFTHIYLGFESAGVKDEQSLYAFATLQMLLGGGGSFSAGGPGKGMYSRLYTRVLNQHAWIESCMAFHHCYIDTGLFGISGSCQPKAEHALLDVMAGELEALTIDSEGNGSISPSSGSSRLLSSLRRPFRGGANNFAATYALSDEEVNRAKNQLKSNLLMNLESRMVQLEDLGRQVQISDTKVPSEQMIKHIDSVTISQLQKAARNLISRPATLVAKGEITGLQSYAASMLANHGISLKEGGNTTTNP
ncbi:Mitochondrial-processing peptidase subunit alpha [Mycoemilia scoparia]|uniref:Alpha-MPP n=1 Tax=Mycoemilia scoparia TaxID=417184 RepID=A0A9W8DUR4_9FUNG|nr:Mitochondrial-processing peptidase subunit alpha [Mycoemilia scoparia]